jgi:hypothetical protein
VFCGVLGANVPGLKPRWVWGRIFDRLKPAAFSLAPLARRRFAQGLKCDSRNVVAARLNSLRKKSFPVQEKPQRLKARIHFAALRHDQGRELLQNRSVIEFFRKL